MKQRIQEQTEPKKFGGSVYITLSPVVRRIAGIEVGQAVTVIAERAVFNSKGGGKRLNDTVS
jgi:hypothetical protein